MTVFQAGGVGRNRYANAGGSVWNSADKATSGSFTWTFTEGDAAVQAGGVNAGGPYGSVRGVQAQTSGKWYFEIECVTMAATPQNFGGGICDSAATLVAHWQDQTGSGNVSYHGNGQMFKNGTTFLANSTAYSAGAVLGFAVDMTAKTVSIYLNNVLKRSGETFTASSMKPYQTFASFQGGKSRLKTAAGSLTYAPPTGFTAWG